MRTSGCAAAANEQVGEDGQWRAVPGLAVIKTGCVFCFCGACMMTIIVVNTTITSHHTATTAQITVQRHVAHCWQLPMQQQRRRCKRRDAVL